MAESTKSKRRPDNSRQLGAPTLVRPQPADEVSTRSRIIDRTIHLFNRRGVRNVAVDHIALNLRISPGNLTYYFKRKRDLIRATLLVLRAKLSGAMTPPSRMLTERDNAEYLIEVFRTFWNFRFFFNDLTYLVSIDQSLHKEYLEIREWCVNRIEDTVSFLQVHEYFRPPAPNNSVRLLAENIWSTWLSWLRRSQMETPYASVPESEALYDCAIHHWSLIEPWLTAASAQSLLREFKVILKPDEAPVEEAE